MAITSTEDSLVHDIESWLDANQAIDPVRIDLRGRSAFADFMIVASGRSQRHVASLAEHIVENLKKAGILPRAEGLANAEWVLIDAGDVVVHIFKPDARAYYDLEKLWEEEPALVHSSAPRRRPAD